MSFLHSPDHKHLDIADYITQAFTGGRNDETADKP